MRSKKALMNMIASISYELIAVVCGLILPRLILSTFGSSYNGITSSITQFLACAALLKAGVGGVTRAALYKPLADNDITSISAIVNSTSRFMRRIALVLVAGIAVFACIYPFLVIEEFEWVFSATLVLILGISTFVQYYFGIPFQLLLEADQKQYIISVSQIVSTILNTIFAAILIKAGFGIHIVKLGSAVAFSLNPLIINRYCYRVYGINKKIAPNNDAIKQRWDAFWQSVAFFVHNNTGTIILTCFTNIREISVYTVYNYVIVNIRNVIMTFVTGFGAAFGNMLAKGEEELAKINLRIYELIVFSLVAIIYSTAGTMIVSFAMVYTTGVNDVNYARPLFAFLITVAGAFSCFRVPYQTIVEAAGHFKQTRNGAFIEAGLNIIISVIAVIKFGLIGVAFGTVVATVFRSVQYSVYLSRNIIKRSVWLFWKHVIIDAAIAGITFGVSKLFFTFETPDFFMWAVKAAMVCIVSVVLTGLSSVLFYREDTINLITKMKTMLMRKRTKESV